MVDLSSLPDTIASLFGTTTDGTVQARFYSAAAGREVEQALAEYGISYRTRIVRSRTKGICYLITLLEETSDDIFA